ncbi:MAG: alkaline phosphatase family protein [Deltaproteobacteria bacterium]|nr:alkaline phosphatase family protein [Deltaproteobacteria bacterium]
MSRAVRDEYKIVDDEEMMEPMVLSDDNGTPIGRIKDGDSVIFYNIRGEREIELTESLTEGAFDRFPVKKMNLNFATMIEYRKGLNVRVAFPPEDRIVDTLSETISKAGRKQVKITELEKAVHLGFFLNGKNGDPFSGEERVVVPTRQDVVLFDEAPDMSIDRITEAVIEKIHDETYDFVVTNLPNVDVLGHIENSDAIVKAVEVVDKNAGLIIEEALQENMTIIVTADHGTVEKWYYPDGVIDTGHTDSPVPFILLCKDRRSDLRQGGELTDIAPTILQLMGIAKPEAMTGKSLIQDRSCITNRRLLMVILDGWGFSKKEEGNLIAKAQTPVMDKLIRTYPFTTLKASGDAVGLPRRTVGNSEAGHLHIGAGRKIYSDSVRITCAIEDGSFFRNEAFLNVMRKAKENASALHLLGIVSFFSSHGSVDNLFRIMELAKREGLEEVFIHSMLGRRGEKPESGALYIEKIEEKCEELQTGQVVSVIGRYWSMDREENWDRIEKTYRMLVCGEGRHICS